MDEETVNKWISFIMTAVMEIKTNDRKKILHAANMLELAVRRIREDLGEGREGEE